MKKKIIYNGIETNYSVTDDARIFNDITGRELKGTYSTNEYHSVQLTIDGKPKTFMFHRLVAEAFCENPNGYTIVDHIDRNKRNDHASNLRWVTQKENVKNVEKPKLKVKNEKYTGSFETDNWKPIYEHDAYMISKQGIVVNTKTHNIMTSQLRHGYHRVTVDDSHRSLHVLVWETFNEQKVPKGMHVDHIDGDKSNNCLENLRVIDASANMKNAYANGHKGQVAVKQYTLDGKHIADYPTMREAAKAVNASEVAIKEATLRHGTCAEYYWLRESDPITIEEVMYNWIPEGYRLIKTYPTYCINQEGDVYNKKNKKSLSVKYRANGEPYVFIHSTRINIKTLLQMP